MPNNKDTYGHTPTSDDNYQEVYDFMGIDINDVGKPIEIENPTEELKIEDGNPKNLSKSKAKPKDNEPESEEDIVEGEDNEEEIEEDEEEESQEDSESYNDLDEEEEDEEDISGKKSIPLRTYLDLKSKYKDARRKNAEYEDKLLDQEDLDLQRAMVDELVNEGMDENMAKIQAKYLAKVQAKSRKASNFEEQVTDELTDLAYDDYFSDALEYKLPIIKMMKDYKSKGINLTAEQAYLNVLGATKLKLKSKTQKMKQNTAKRLENKRKGNMQYRKPTKNDSGSTAGKFRLSSDDMAALRELQRAQPSAGWTKQKYYKMQHSDD